MRVNENGQYVSDDGFWVWDGAAWIAADGSAAPTPTEGGDQAAAGDTGSGSAEGGAAGPDPDATQTYEAVDYASDTTAAGVMSPTATGDPAPQGTLATGDGVVPQVDNAHPMSPDGQHWWDGEQWIDVSTGANDLHSAGLAQDTMAGAGATADLGTAIDSGWQGTDQELTQSEPEPAAVLEAAQPARQLSPDGMWEWNGTQWVPAEQQAPEPEPEPAPVAAVASVQPARQLSPDGHWEWDGSAWVPAQQAAVAPVPAGAHVSPDGHWWWDGSQWLPTGR